MDKSRLAKMLVLGIPQARIATALGVSEGRISQLKSGDKELIELISHNAAVRASHEIKQDATLESIERKLLSRADDLASTSDSLAETINAYHKIQDTKLRKQVAAPPTETTKLELHISDRALASLDIQMDGNKNIMSIRGRSMATMPAKNVLDIVSPSD